MNIECGALVAMTDITKAFSGVEVLSGVQFELKAGEVHVLAGENGAGKSTLIKILAGVHTEYGGRIVINGEAMHFKSVQDAAKAGISVIYQELSLVGPMSVVDNIFLGREKTHSFGWADCRSQTADVNKSLVELGLNIDVNRAVEKYPLSIQQMIEISKSLAFDCRIIVMDEPTSALSEPEVEKLFQIVEQLKRRGCGIIYISHKMDEIYRIADRITVLRDGRYVGTALAAKLSQDELIKWMVGRELNTQFPRHVSHVGKQRIEVSNFSLPDPSGKPFMAVSKVSFSVHAGEILGIGGLQGSGSSELLNGIFGTYGKRTFGEVKIDGDVFVPGSPGEAIDKGIALLTNDRKETGLVLEMDIVQNATLASLRKFSPACWLRPREEAAAVAKRATSLRVKASSLNQLVCTLSGGNQQKVVMAKWIETNPKVLMLDEPTRGVDVGAKQEIYELMNEWTSQGIAIILITSEMSELLAMSDRIIVMHRGKITAEFARETATQEKILNAAMGEKDRDYVKIN